MALNEISTADAYQRFYKDKVPTDVWNTLMDGAKNMTPFHKLMLDYITSGQFSRQDVATIANLSYEIWNKSDLCRQFVVNAVNSKFSGLKPDKLIGFLATVKDQIGYSEAEYIDSGFVKLFENERMLVTATLTYAANKKYYGDSHWCTASDVGGRYNGWKMFKRYGPSNGSVLIQLVDKQDRNNTLQVSYYENGEIDTACNFFDESVSVIEVENFVEDIGGIGYNELMRKINLETLVNETEAKSEDEDSYWKMKTEEYLNKGYEAVKKVMAAQEFSDLMIESIKHYYVNYETDENCPFYVSSSRSWDIPNRKVFSVELKLYEPELMGKLFGDNVAGVLGRLQEDGDSRVYGKLYWTYLVDVGDGTHEFNIIKKFNGKLLSIDNRAVTLTSTTGKNEQYNFVFDIIDGNIVFNGFIDGEPFRIKCIDRESIGVGQWEWDGHRLRWKFIQSYVINTETFKMTEKYKVTY